MAQVIRAACPQCHYEQQLGFSIGSLTAVGNGMNVAVTCPICRTLFDATGGGDGTFEPDERGYLRRVRDAAQLVWSLRQSEREALLRELLAVQRGTKAPEEARAAAGDGEIRRFWDLVPRTRSDVYAFIAMLIAILAMFQSQPDSLTPGQVERLVETVIREMPPAPEAPGEMPGSPPPRKP